MRCLIAAITLCALVLAGRGQADVPPRFERLETAKGIPFVYREDPRTPFAAINFGMRDIYGLTTRGKEGFNALGPALVMQGADGAGQTEFTERMRDLTAGASVSIGPFSSQGGVRAPAATLAASMALFASALKDAAPTDKLLGRLKQRASGGEAQSALRAETIAERAGLRFALGDHPVTRGFDPERFERIGTDDVALWRKAVLGRDRLRLAASGRIGKVEASRIIDAAFADLPSLGAISPVDWPPVEVTGGMVVVEHDTPQSAVLLIGLTSIGPAREAELAILANAVLGAGSNSRLWNGVRASLGSTYGASSGFRLIGPGKRLVALRAAVANDQVGASIEALRKTYAEWRAEGITAAELRSTSTRMITEFRSALDDPSRANGLVIGASLSGRPLEDVVTYESRLSGIDRQALNQFILAKFPPVEQLVTVIVTPRTEGLGPACTIRTEEEAAGCRR